MARKPLIAGLVLGDVLSTVGQLELVALRESLQGAQGGERTHEGNGCSEGAKATGWKQAINQLAVAYPNRFAEYL